MIEMKTEYAIKVTNLMKKYGDLVAVDHIDFEVKKGEVFGFLGPNGAGKTTSIKMLLSLIKPTAGTATLLGQPFVKDPDVSVSKLLAAGGAKVTAFVRFEVGEGIEKKEDNFVEEVMAQVKGAS